MKKINDLIASIKGRISVATRGADKKWVAIVIRSVTTALGGLNFALDATVNAPGEPEVVEVEKVVVEQASTIELGEEPAIVEVETTDGVVEEALPVVEMADSNISIGEDKIDGGKGEYFPTATPREFANAIIGRCIDQDGYYGSQCWDLSDALFFNLVGRHLSTCGTGAAKGIMNCAEANAGEDFEIIRDANEIQAGDILVFDGGRYGHTGMAMGSPANGYVALLGANQGGGSCDGGGAAANIVAYSLNNFTGALRYKPWIKIEIPTTGHHYLSE